MGRGPLATCSAIAAGEPVCMEVVPQVVAIGRWVALVGLVLGYQVVGEACSRAVQFEYDWMRAWLPPVVLLSGCVAWLKIWPIRWHATAGPGAWPIRGLLAAVGCAIVVFALAVQCPIAGAAPSWTQSLALVAVVPVAEELLFRGILLAELRATIGTAGAVIVVSVLFGCLHGGATISAVMLLLSAICCCTVLLTRSVISAIGLHALWNGWCVVHRTSAAHGRLGVALALGALALILAVGWRAPHPREA